LSDSPFKIIRTFSTGASIKKKVLPLILAELTDPVEIKNAEKKFDKLLKSYKDTLGSRFSMYDYNPVKSLTSTTQFMNADSALSYSLPYCKDKAAIAAGFMMD